MASPKPRPVIPYEASAPPSHWWRFRWLWGGLACAALLLGTAVFIVSVGNARVNATRVLMAAPPPRPMLPTPTMVTTTPATQPATQPASR
jgi:hypothetical protein